MHLLGVDSIPELKEEFDAVYASAKQKNLWPNSYAISNREEYFATCTAIWFNVMSESADGSWDGVRGPVNTREELKAYDVDMYNFLAKIYPETEAVSDAWADVPDNFHPGEEPEEPEWDTEAIYKFRTVLNAAASNPTATTPVQVQLSICGGISMARPNIGDSFRTVTMNTL